MKKAALYLLMFFACFSVFAQTRLERSGILRVFQDITGIWQQYSGNQTIQIIIIDRSTATLPAEAFAGTGAHTLIFDDLSLVTAIPSGAFSNSSSLISIKLPLSLKTIETNAFSSCTSLRHITLPSGLKEIHGSAFRNTRISRLYIPDTVTFVGAGILRDTTNLQSVRLPRNANVDRNNDFFDAYIHNGRMAGVYAKLGDEWRFQLDRTEHDYYSSF